MNLDYRAPEQNADGMSHGQPDTASESGTWATRKLITVLTAVLGGAVVLGIGATAAVAVTGEAASGPASPAATEGVNRLDIEIGAAELTVEYADVSEATLRPTRGTSNGWKLTRAGSSLKVQSPRTKFNGLCILGICPDSRGNTHVVLQLPEKLSQQDLDAKVQIGVGTVHLDGQFAALDMRIDAGDLSVKGSAHTLTGKVNVGTFRADLADVQHASVKVAAGDSTLVFRGTQPDLLDFDVNVGSIDVTVPVGEYALQQRGGIGNVQSSIAHSANSPHQLRVSVDLGDIRLREQR